MIQIDEHELRVYYTGEEHGNPVLAIFFTIFKLLEFIRRICCRRKYSDFFIDNCYAVLYDKIDGYKLITDSGYGSLILYHCYSS